jgi:hypothetical protein
MMQQQQQQHPIITMPTANDVLCGRGKSCNNHSGNIQFISIVKEHVQTYMNLSSRFEKTLLVRNLVHQFRNELGVQFLRKSSSSSSSCWYPLNEDESNTKVGHAIRDMIKTNRKKSNNNNNNSNKSSQAIKTMKEQQQQQQMTPITATTTICFEPIQCHSTEDLCDHCITARSLSLKTSDLLTSILNVVETTTAKEDEVNDCDCLSTEMLTMTALPPPLPPQRTRYICEESCAFPPAPVLSSSSSSSSSSLLLYDDRRSPSFCVVKAFGLDRIGSNEDECYSNRIMNDDLGTIFQI